MDTKPVIPEVVEYADGILHELHETLVVRGRNYADIRENSQVFATLMSNLGVDRPHGMSDTDFHCLANICTKLARMTTGSRLHEDNWLDLAGYAILALADIRQTKARKAKPCFHDYQTSAE
jgi:hypothetical protein